MDDALPPVSSTEPKKALEELREEFFFVGATETELLDNGVRGKIRCLIDGYVDACGKVGKRLTIRMYCDGFMLN
ncbi:hypothetical protein GCM10027085_42750 [Spirosoma aerophilum]